MRALRVYYELFSLDNNVMRASRVNLVCMARFARSASVIFSFNNHVRALRVYHQKLFTNKNVTIEQRNINLRYNFNMCIVLKVTQFFYCVYYKGLFTH